MDRVILGWYQLAGGLTEDFDGLPAKNPLGAVVPVHDRTVLGDGDDGITG